MATTHINYDDLFARWETEQWSATALEFRDDQIRWRQLTPPQREALKWQFSLFLFAEDAVTADLTPYIRAAPTREQRMLLAAQQADEARHTVFFSRAIREVVGTDGTVGSQLRRTASLRGWPFVRIFERLNTTAESLHVEPSRPQFTAALVTYHLILEAMLAQPTNEMLADAIAAIGGLPSLYKGMKSIVRDEQRHVAFGVKAISELVAEDINCKTAAEEEVQRMLPKTLVFRSIGAEPQLLKELGSSTEALYRAGWRSFLVKASAAGLSVKKPTGPLTPASTAETRGLRSGGTA